MEEEKGGDNRNKRGHTQDQGFLTRIHNKEMKIMVLKTKMPIVLQVNIDWFFMLISLDSMVVNFYCNGMTLQN